MSNISNLPVYKDVYRLVNMLLDDMENIPVKHRRTLTDRILNTAYDCITLFHFAYGTSQPRERTAHLERFLTKFDLLKTLLRITNERRLISLKRATSINELITSISKQIGGWKKSTENK